MKKVIFTIFIMVLFIVGSVTGAIADNRATHDQVIDALVTESMDKYRIPGLSLGIVKGNSIVYLKGYGVADHSGRPVTAQTPFILGSVSKSFTALAIMQLAEQGKLDLDGAVQNVLPWLQLHDSVGQQVTIRQLLNQTSGISTYEGRAILGEGSHSLEQTVGKQSGIKLAEPSGSKFQYSNTNYVILGEIVQSASGLSYDRYIKNHILTPLVMENSYADKSEAEKGGLANGYQSLFGRLVPTNPKVWKSNVPAGYLISSAEDMTHYMIAQMNGGVFNNTTVLSPEGMKTMHRASEVFPYGMGWFTSPLAISHAGDTENFHSDITMFPDSGWGIVVLMNTNNALMTALYGNVYEEISVRLMNLVSEGDLFPRGIPEATRIGQFEVYIDILLCILAVWIMWSVYSLKYWRRTFNKSVFGIVVIHVLILLCYLVIPIILFLEIPRVFIAPWKVLLLYIPGVSHALLSILLLSVSIGIIRLTALVYGIKCHMFR